MNAPYACLYFPQGLEKDPLQALAEACLRFSSQVALHPGEAVFLEVHRSRLLHQGRSLAWRLKELARPYGPCRLAFGRHAAEALALAVWQKEKAAELPLEALHRYASPFQSDAEAEAQVAAMIGAFAGLGIKNAGAMLALPPKSLGERFGAEAAMLRERLEGVMEMAWPRFSPQTQIEEREELRSMENLQACTDLESLLFTLKGTVDRLAARLRGRGLRAQHLEVELGLDLGRGKLRLRRIDLPLALPQSAPRELLVILRERLDGEFQRRPLELALATIQIKVLESSPGPGAQIDFFENREKEVEAWNSLISRLSQKLGPDQVFLAELVQRYLPERAWRRVLKEPQSIPAPAPPSLPERPSRLLPKAIPLMREGDTLLAPRQKRVWHAKAWEGPERLSGEWWEEDFARDYYRVSTEEGRDLWVYAHEGQDSKGVWLQGYFD